MIKLLTNYSYSVLPKFCTIWYNVFKQQILQLVSNLYSIYGKNVEGEVLKETSFVVL